MIEYRTYKIENRAEDSRIVEGYGSVFNSQSLDLGFIETIDPRAITQETIARSDVFATLNHDTDKILARCKYGSGSLELKCDDKGLYYRFEAPNTDLGNEVLEYLRRGDIDSSSFAFTVKRDEWRKGDDGQYYRTILEVDQLFDVSPVFQPAYPEATCQKRNMPSDYENEIHKLEIREMEDEKEKEQCEEPKSEPVIEEKPQEEPKAEEPKEEPTEEPKEEPKEETTEDKSCDEKEDESEERNNQNTNKSNIRKMEKRFSLVAELRSAMETGKSINLSELQKRAYTVTDEGADLVQTDVYDILEPLRAKNVLVAAGAKFMTGLVGNVQVPVMSAGNVAWKGETAAAADGSGSFAQVALSPKRLTGKFPISLELLAQDGIGVEDAIRRDIINAINDKLEATILGSAQGTTTQPAGLFYGYTEDDTVIADFGDVADLEAGLEAANVYGECKYIVSPAAKALLRSTVKGNAGVGMIMENGAVDGTPALCTSHVPAGDLIYGDFSNLIIGQWGDIQLDVVRDTDSLANGCVTIVVNAYFDAAVARSAAFACANV